MTGSLLALVAIGKQDKELIGNPIRSFFKSVYVHHTHFAMESISFNFDQSLIFGKKSTLIIPRKADLLHKLVLEIKLPALGEGISWVNGIGHALIREVSVEIGGVKIDSHTGEFMEILSNLELPESKKWGYYNMIGRHEQYNKYTQTTETTLHIPLQFWFCRHIGDSLPLVAMQYHDVKISVHLREFSELWYSGPTMTNIPTPIISVDGRLHCDYIFLGDKERVQFAKSEHKYLIEQVQIADGIGVNENSVNDNIDVFFNHPVKDLMWIYKADDIKNTNDWFNFSKTLNYVETLEKPKEPVAVCQWKINGHDLMEEKSGTYFRTVIPYQRYIRIPDNFVYVHSFSINPSQYQPSGHLNFSMISSSVLSLTYTDRIPQGSITVYARNYNILEIRAGQAGLKFSS
jgi:hypothetical protein